ncbi:hypothetical protein ACWA5Z_06850 [Testudinibacter sp. P80/BLE/0925]
MFSIYKEEIIDFNGEIAGATFDTHGIFKYLSEAGFDVSQTEREPHLVDYDFDIEIAMMITGKYADVHIFPGSSDIGLNIKIESTKITADRLYKCTDPTPRIGTRFNSVHVDDSAILKTINDYLSIANNLDNFCYIGKTIEESKFSPKNEKEYFPFTRSDFSSAPLLDRELFWDLADEKLANEYERINGRWVIM